MATPRQTLAGSNQVPSAAVIAHEVGHSTVAFLQVSQIKKRTKCCIVFRHQGNGVGAASHNPTNVSSPHELIMRHLAGITSQAIHCPDTIEAVLREKLIGGSLFASDQSLEDKSPEANAMKRHNAWSDWDNAMEESKRISPNAELRLTALRKAQRELLELMHTDRFGGICRDMIANATRWLDEEPAEPDFLAIYPEGRIAEVFAQHPDQ